MSINLNVHNIDKNENLNNQSMIVQDIAGCMIELGVPCKIVNIQNYDNLHSQEEKFQELSDVLQVCKNTDYAIITTAYVSTVEFPPDEYYMPNTNDITQEVKKPIPFDDIIERESKLLEDLGFVNINSWVGYEFMVAYIYNNEIGQKIINHINTTKVSTYETV